MSLRFQTTLASIFAAAALLTSCHSKQQKSEPPESKFKPNITVNAATSVVVQQKTPYDVISVDFKDGSLTETLYVAGSIYSPKDSVSTIPYTVCFENMDHADSVTVNTLRQHLPPQMR